MSQTSQPISFRFIPTKDDYVHSIRAFFLCDAGFKRTLVIMGIVELLIVVAALAGNLGDGLLLWLLALAMPALLVYLWVILPLNTGRQIEKNERFMSETTWELGEDQVLIKNKFSETKMDWGSFQKVVETGDYYLLVYTANKRMFQFIPKRAFESQEHAAAFREVLRQKLG